MRLVITILVMVATWFLLIRFIPSTDHFVSAEHAADYPIRWWYLGCAAMGLLTYRLTK